MQAHIHTQWLCHAQKQCRVFHLRGAKYMGELGLLDQLEVVFNLSGPFKLVLLYSITTSLP